MKKIIAVIISVSLLLPALTGFAATDFNGHWAAFYISYLKSEGIVSGDANGNMRPDDSITRAEFAQVTNKAFGYFNEGTERFSDVSENEWYYSAMNIALNEGYFKGDENKNGNPEKQITRAEAATAFARILKLDVSDTDTGFTDDSSIPSWAKGAVKALKDKGIINGYSDGSYKPFSEMKRAEYFTITAKKLQEVTKEPEKEEPITGSSISMSNVGKGTGGSGGGGGGGGGGGSFTPQITAAPANLFFDADGFNLSWDKVYTASSYDGVITRTTEGKADGSESFTSAAERYNIEAHIKSLMSTDKAENETFKILLRAIGAYGTSAYTEFDISVTNTVVALPEFTVSQSFDDNGAESISVNWTPSEDAAGYSISVDFGSGYEPLSVNSENNSATLSESQIAKISGKHSLKYSVTSVDEDRILSVADKCVDIDFPLFGGTEREGGNDYILISNNRHFENITDKALNYKLMEDVTLSSWTSFEGFKGIFDGNLKSVTLPLNSENGLFKSITADAVVKNLTVCGSITATADTVGGVVASNSGTVENCVSNVEISGAGITGGIVGDNLSGAAISASVNNGSITATGTMVGGIAGQSKGKINLCGNNGNIESASSRIGGIAGYLQNGNIYKSYNTGAVKGDGNGVSGIVGQTAGSVTISDSFNAGNIKTSNAQAGGLGVAGIDGNSVSGGDNIVNCYNIGVINHTTTDVSVSNAIFGTNRSAEVPVNMSNCYFLSESAVGAKDDTVNLTDTQMKEKKSFTGFDFGSVWEMGGEAYPCPVITGAPFTFELPSGTAMRPYVIRTDADFARINSFPEDYYTLLGDVTVNTYTEIAEFSGNFNGNGFKIIYEEESQAPNGLFTKTTATAVVKNVVISGKIGNADAVTIGGVAGTNNGTVENCINEAHISGKSTVGGIVGDNKKNITGSVNKGDITSSGQKAGGISGQQAAGGLISGCGNEGLVTAGSTYCGGITAYMIRSTIEKSYNKGTVSGTKNVGGIVGMGQAKHTITNCFNEGTISASGSNTSGGISGFASPVGTEVMTYEFCYNLGYVKYGENDKTSENGILGLNNTPANAVNVNNCRYLSDTEIVKDGISADIKTVNLEESEFATADSFEGWDFENIWVIGTVNGKACPILK